MIINKTLLNGAMFSIFSFINRGFSFILLLVLAKFFTPKEYGYLRGITTLAVVPPVITDASFGDPYYTHTITVPKGCGESYKAAAGWSNYADYIVEASE